MSEHQINSKTLNNLKGHMVKLGFGVAMGALFTGAAIAVSSAGAQAATIHTVSQGETLSGIAAGYGVDWHDLAKSNNLSNPDLIFPDQKIVISEDQDTSTHTVVAGETLSGIAYQHGVSWQDLAAVNGLANPDLIFEGQVISLSVSQSSNSTQAPAQQNPAPVETPSAPAPVETPTSTAPSGSIESMIEQVFGPYASQAKRVAMCESTYNPHAYNPSGASGLFQIMPSTFAGTSQAGGNVFDAATNIKAAYEIFSRDGYSWYEWVCQP